MSLLCLKWKKSIPRGWSGSLTACCVQLKVDYKMLDEWANWWTALSFEVEVIHNTKGRKHTCMNSSKSMVPFLSRSVAENILVKWSSSVFQRAAVILYPFILAWPTIAFQQTRDKILVSLLANMLWNEQQQREPVSCTYRKTSWKSQSSRPARLCRHRSRRKGQIPLLRKRRC